jgi:ferric-dicitrate binding protein FerR (iron transport regulator)
MTTCIIRRGLVFASLLCVLASTARAQKAGAVDAVLPEAAIRRGRALIPAAKGTEISWNDLLRTSDQGRLRVMLVDQSLISVGPKSEVRVIQPIATSNQSSLELTYGKVSMRLTKQPGERFELRTPTAVAGVIGTDFGADASVPGTTHFICLEGEVRISNADPRVPGSVICRGGYMTDVKEGQPPAEPTPAPPEHMENWRRNNEPDGKPAVAEGAHQH